MARVVLMDEAQAALVRGETALGAALAPRRVAAGPHVGLWILPERVLADPAHASVRHLLAVFPVVEIDPAEAWPPTEED